MRAVEEDRLSELMLHRILADTVDTASPHLEMISELIALSGLYPASREYIVNKIKDELNTALVELWT